MAEYLTENCVMPIFYMFPKWLLNADLSETGKLLYMLLFDRARLSLENNWIDDQGHVYIIFSIKNMAEAMGKSETTIKNCLADLEKKNLIRRVHQSSGRANRIYVKTKTDDIKTYRPQTESCLSDRQKTVSIKAGKLSANNNDNNKTNKTRRWGCSHDYSYEEGESL